MNYILDRFENEFAILVSKNGDTITVLRECIPDRREGDVFTIIDASPVYDRDATEKRKRDLGVRFSKLVRRR